MRPLTCHAGFPLPLYVGKVEVCGVSATVNDPTAVSRLTLIDDMDLPRGTPVGRILTDDGQKVPFIDIKGLANADARLTEIFFEPVKMIYGVSVTNAQNLLGGKVMLYVR